MTTRMTRTMVGCAFAVLVAAPLRGQEVERVAGRSVAIFNLAGHVEIVPGSGSDVVVRIARGGADAASLQIETGTVRGVSTLRIVYPHDQIVYPEMIRGSSTSVTVREDGTFSRWSEGRGDRVQIRERGDGLEAWADLVIEVPAGRELSVYQAVGEVAAEGVEGEVAIDTGSGAVRAVDTSGPLSIDTGSGTVEVRGVAGDLLVETGSGRVDVADVRGGEIAIDTGSGRVTGAGLSAESVTVETGSGAIELQAVAAPAISLDTGSGSIDVELLEDVDRLHADTGSGSVTVRAPDRLGAVVEIETGSGGIDLDFPADLRSTRRNRVEGTIGDGRGEIRIDTGSGGVRLTRGR